MEGKSPAAWILYIGAWLLIRYSQPELVAGGITLLTSARTFMHCDLKVPVSGRSSSHLWFRSTSRRELYMCLGAIRTCNNTRPALSEALVALVPLSAVYILWSMLLSCKVPDTHHLNCISDRGIYKILLPRSPQRYMLIPLVMAFKVSISLFYGKRQDS